MMVGFDFDNTLVGYGDLFYTAALEAGLIPSGFSRSKTAIRDLMNETGMRDEWTALQGKVYGTMMDRAQLFPGVSECLQELKKRDIPCCIISHKTRYAKKGPPYDLHRAARDFLRRTGLPIPQDMIFFCPERAEKIRLIRELKCTCFVDDLPEVFAEPDFPPGVKKILFGAAVSGVPSVIACPDWDQIGKELLAR